MSLVEVDLMNFNQSELQLSSYNLCYKFYITAHADLILLPYQQFASCITIVVPIVRQFTYCSIVIHWWVALRSGLCVAYVFVARVI